MINDIYRLRNAQFARREPLLTTDTHGVARGLRPAGNRPLMELFPGRAHAPVGVEHLVEDRRHGREGCLMLRCGTTALHGIVATSGPINRQAASQLHTRHIAELGASCHTGAHPGNHHVLSDHRYGARADQRHAHLV